MLKYLLLLVLTIPNGFTETDYCKVIGEREKWSVEVRQWDDSRIDLISNDYAIEVDYAHKWTEAIGQALYYEITSGKKPAILLLIKKGEERYAWRAQAVCAKHDIKMYIEYIDTEFWNTIIKRQ